MEKKITKREMYEAVITAMETGDSPVAPDAVIEFCKNEIALLDKKAEKARERAAEKRAAGDELTDVVRVVMSTEEFEPIADIAAKVAATIDDVSVAKITYRLTQLVKNGEAENTDIKIPGGEGQKTRTIKGYRLLNVQA